MIIFKKLTIEGFGIFSEPYTFILDKPGVNILALPNGRGKSTIFGALVWCIYGKPLKEKSTIATYEKDRPLTWRGTKVELSFVKNDIKYLVTRCKDFKGKVQEQRAKNGLFISMDGAPYNDEKAKRDIQKVLEAIIGYSFELFTNTVIFPQRAKRFIEESGSDKRRIFEEVFNLDWIPKALDEAKSIRTTVNTSKVKIEATLKQAKTSKLDYSNFLERLASAKSEFESAKATKIASIESQIEEAKKSSGDLSYKDSYLLAQTIQNQEVIIRELTEKEEFINLDLYVKTLNSLSYNRDLLLVKLCEKEEALGKYMNSQEDFCETCGQRLPHDTKLTLIDGLKAEVDLLKPQLAGLNAEISKLLPLVEAGKSIREELNVVRDLLNSAYSELRVIDNYNKSIDLSMSKVSSLESQLEAEKKQEYQDISGPIREKLQAVLITIRNNETALKALEQKAKIYDWIITKVFSESGLKSYIISSMIDLLNQKLLFYQKFVPFRVEVEVDLASARKDINTIIYRDGYPVILEDLSGGERQLVNIIIAFALTELIGVSVGENTTNLSIFDEVFESLDSTNTEIVSELIQSRVNPGGSIFIITHKLDFVIQNSNHIDI